MFSFNVSVNYSHCYRQYLTVCTFCRCVSQFTQWFPLLLSNVGQAMAANYLAPAAADLYKALYSTTV